MILLLFDFALISLARLADAKPAFPCPPISNQHAKPGVPGAFWKNRLKSYSWAIGAVGRRQIFMSGINVENLGKI
jgi:hypothetical protein